MSDLITQTTPDTSRLDALYAQREFKKSELDKLSAVDNAIDQGVESKKVELAQDVAYLDGQIAEERAKIEEQRKAILEAELTEDGQYHVDDFSPKPKSQIEHDQLDSIGL